jgi:His-Xaa-Ser system protein HxsD
MTGVTFVDPQPFAMAVGNSTAALTVDTTIYSLAAVLRACYKYTDRCYLFMTREPDAAHMVNVCFMPKQSSPLAEIVGEFCNELVDQSLRVTLAAEFGQVRDLIVAQAFSEGNLLDPQRDEGDYTNDPLGIGERR